MAILSPVDKQIDIAVEIRDAVEKAIALDPFSLNIGVAA
jgi:hypothetical protein